jgi:DNA-binding response OmpR family regulator
LPASEDREVLIIEDSPAVGMLLKEFLNKLGFKKTRHCENGKTGIETFKEMVESGTVPLVFLDYNLPDMTGFSIMSQMLTIRPDVKVIIESAREKSEDVIKDVIAQGAYQYLSKPLRLEKIKEVVETLRSEESQIAEDDTSKAIEKLVTNSTQISVLRISQYLNRTDSEILSHIKRLIADKKAVQINDVKEIGCPKCSSVRITQTFHCPKCRSTSFKQERIIEHYNCGNVSPASSYTDDKCPKCHIPIKIFGVDYRVQENFHICNDCSEIFAEVLIEYLCLKCSDRFTFEHARFFTSQGFSCIK